MMRFTATFWRSNPQLRSGGYWTERTIEAKTLGAAVKEAHKIGNACSYGSMELRGIERKKEKASPSLPSRYWEPQPDEEDLERMEQENEEWLAGEPALLEAILPFE